MMNGINHDWYGLPKIIIYVKSVWKKHDFIK